MQVEWEKVELLAQKKEKFDDEYRYETKQLRAEIGILNTKVTKLVDNLANIGQSQMLMISISVIIEWKEKMKQLQH